MEHPLGDSGVAPRSLFNQIQTLVLKMPLGGGQVWSSWRADPWGNRPGGSTQDRSLEPRFWSEAWCCLAGDCGVLAPSLRTLDSRAQNQEAEGWWPGLPAGSDVWQIWFPECLGMMTTQFPSADGRDGCDFRIHLAVTHTHTHTHTLRSWGLCFHDPERATVPGDPLRPRLPPSGVQPKLQ